MLTVLVAQLAAVPQSAAAEISAAERTLKLTEKPPDKPKMGAPKPSNSCLEI